MPYSYHLKFDIKIVKLANIIDQGLEGKLFMRYYIPTFNNRRIQVDTREIQINRNIVSWDEYASLECNANLDQIEQVMKSSHVTFELRWKRTKQVFMARSRLLGSGEISFKEVMVSSEAMKLKKWVNLSAGGVKLDESKLPNLLVEMEVQVKKDVGLNEKFRFSVKDCDCLGCEIDMFHVETLVD